jgi:hypothetical protein
MYRKQPDNSYFAVVKSFLFALISIAFFSCGNTAKTTPATASDSVTDSAIAPADRRDVNASCCFQTEKEFEAFFPAACGKFTLQPLPSVALKCLTDTITHSSARYGYTNAEGHLVTVTLADYCTSPAMLQTDYSMQYERCRNEGTKSEFNEFDVPSSHHGFTHFNSATRTATLVVVVDNRFLLEIDDQVCENTKNVLALYEQLPVALLSAYRK